MSSYYNTYKSWIYLSISLHFLIIVSFIISSRVSYNRPIVVGVSEEGSINVDMVGLPNVLKKDINTLAESKETIEIKPKAEVMVLPNAKKIKADKKNILEQLRTKIQEESSYLKKIKIIKGIKQSIGIGKGASSTAKAGGGGGTGNMPTNPYFNTMKDLIRSYWRVPRWINLDDLNTLIVIKVNESGSIYEIAVEKSSGNKEFDDLAYNAVKNASPFPTPPASLKDTLANGVILSFP